ncbi:hypothetical protein IO073_004641, partial [Salmonella enterica]|nr:hypothetical protein [Salmonella enterica]
MEYLSWRAWG